MNPAVAAQLMGGPTPTSGSVEDTPELRRVLALPTDERIPIDPQELSEFLGARDFCLWPKQAETLVQLHDNEGCFASLPVGEGKTPIGYVAPRLMEAQNAMVIVPGKLTKKTQREYRKLAKHFGQIPSEIVSFSKISRDPKFLQRFAPDLLIVDECHKFKNRGAACTRRFVEWRLANPHVPILMMSGTISDRSLMDFHHLIHLTLGDAAVPLPHRQSEAAKWARAIDPVVEVRCAPGALEFFLEPRDSRDLETIRKRVGHHIHSVPGVVRAEGSDIHASILIELTRPRVPANVRTLMREIETKKIDPSGDECTPADVARHKKTLSTCFHYQWTKPAPKPWLAARRSWKRSVRETREARIPGLDSELQVSLAAKRGQIPDRVYKKWKAIEPAFKPETIAVWHSLEVLEKIAAAATAESIIWTPFEAVGVKLSEMTGWPYYHQKGFDRKGNFIEDHPAGIPAIASIESNKEGRNLQYRFHHNVLTHAPPKTDWEQIIGRTHRRGQEADTVGLLCFCSYQGDDITDAIMYAEYQRDFLQQRRKLLLADWID